MSTYREITSMIMDEVKTISDDSQFTEDHILFLLDKYRAFLLKQKYSDIKKQIPDSNYQTICLDLIPTPAIAGEECIGGSYLRSKTKIPFLINIGVPRVYPMNYYLGDIAYVNRDRMRYIGHNRYLKNIIYCSIGPDGYLYFKSSNPQFLHLEKIKFTGIFQNSIKAAELQCDCCNEDNICDILDKDFPLEESFIQIMVELIVKEITSAKYKAIDENNNAKDDSKPSSYPYYNNRNYSNYNNSNNG